MKNSTNFNQLKYGTKLFMNRYSQQPYPDYIIVKFKSYNKDGRNSLEIQYLNKKNITK